MLIINVFQFFFINEPMENLHNVFQIRCTGNVTRYILRSQANQHSEMKLVGNLESVLKTLNNIINE